MHHDFVTVTRESLSDGFSDATARAGYQDGFTHLELRWMKLIGVDRLKYGERGGCDLLFSILDAALK